MKSVLQRVEESISNLGVIVLTSPFLDRSETF